MPPPRRPFWDPEVQITSSSLHIMAENKLEVYYSENKLVANNMKHANHLQRANITN